LPSRSSAKWGCWKKAPPHCWRRPHYSCSCLHSSKILGWSI
jgi:hypothetical protein